MLFTLPGSEGEGAGVVDLLTLLLWAPVATIPWVRLEVPEPCRGCSLFSASTSSPTQSAKTTSHPPPISVNCTALLAIYQKIRLCRRFLLVLYLCLCVCHGDIYRKKRKKHGKWAPLLIRKTRNASLRDKQRNVFGDEVERLDDMYSV